ncbi:hypothetical protein CLU79DRAFT_707724 [Phycomyces nitens]|nr:hypothetical protein CLU79DRAFT_707724 [Phycomyces nitens]
MAKVLKGMLYCLYEAALNILRDMIKPFFLLLETKLTGILFDAPAGNARRIIRVKTRYLLEAPD